MRLNELSPDPGSRPDAVRVGRGIGSGKGKTAGRGHKGQKARAGGYHKINFEGGQMPIQRRLPKMGFKSRVGRYVAELTLSELQSLGLPEVDMNAIRQSGLIATTMRDVKVILSGKLSAAVKVKGLRVTKGARAAIEAAGGSVEL